MKILVIQLTRFGDILTTLPTLSALRRERPDAEIHLMVRKKFATAAENVAVIDHLWRFDAQKILGHFIDGSQQLTDGISSLASVILELRSEKFDLIINLSFSPSSSYLTHLISQGGTPVLGYTRTADFYLRVPDKPSEYFRAQVGLDKSNRVHIDEILSWIAGVNLVETDRRFFGGAAEPEKRFGVVCHLGASRAHKAWPETSWINFLRNFSIFFDQTVTLIGSGDERAFAEKICSKAGQPLQNKVGETDLNELNRIIGSSRLYIGADSGPMHMANLTNTPVLNLSVGDVRFWETGPTTLGSRVLIHENPEFLGSDFVFEMAREMIEGTHSRKGYAECTQDHGVRYSVYQGAAVYPDYWSLVKWIYFDGPQPAYEGEVQKALTQICEVCDLSITQLEVFHKSPHKVEVVGILDRLDEILEMFRTHITPVSPLLDAFKTQKENIPPGTREEIFYQTKNCYTELQRRAAQLCGKDKIHDGKSLA